MARIDVPEGPGGDAAVVSVTVSLSDGTSTAGRGSVMMSPMPCSLT